MIVNRVVTAPRFTDREADQAHEAWGCNCGPAALAAIVGLTLDEVRPHLKGFDEKRYTNPTMMLDALRSLQVSRRKCWADGEPCWPLYGLARIQWEGPWTLPGVPMRARYRCTHWVGAAVRNGDVGIFDVNCMINGTGWTALADWESTVVPHLTAMYPRASGKWHITHGIEVGR